MDEQNDGDDERLATEFRALLALSHERFAALRNLGPSTPKTLWQPHFQKCFDVFTRLWRLQQQHRFTLEKDEVYGLKRFEVGEIASKIAHLRTSETNYLNEAFVFYAAIRERNYFKSADTIQNSTRQLRYLARYIVVCLLLNRSALVHQLVAELAVRVKEYSHTLRLIAGVQPQPVLQESDGMAEWQEVVREVTSFLEHERFLPVDPNGTPVVVIGRHARQSILESHQYHRRKENRMLRLHNVLILSNDECQVRFSDLTLDMFRMLQSVERVPDTISNGLEEISQQTLQQTEGRLDQTLHHSSRANPQKLFLYKSSFTQFATYLASATKELNGQYGLLVYLSGHGTIPSSTLPDDNDDIMIGSCAETAIPFFTGGLITSHHPTETASYCGLMGSCIHAADLMPYTRHPMLVIIDSHASHAYESMRKVFSAPLLVLMSPRKLAMPSIDQMRTGSLFTLFLHSPLWALCVLCGVRRVASQEVWATCIQLMQECEVHVYGTLTATDANTPEDVLLFLDDVFARAFITRYVICEFILRRHEAYSQMQYEEYYPACRPDFASYTLKTSRMSYYVNEIANLLDVSCQFR